MKKFLVALTGVALVFGLSLPAFAAPTWKFIDGRASGNITDLVVATASKKNKVRSITVSASVAEAVLFKCGSTVKFVHLAPANTPVKYTFDSGQFECSTNEALNMDKTTAGTVVVGGLEYDVQ